VGCAPAAGAADVTVRVIAAGGGPVSPASATSAATSAPSASAPTIATTVNGAFQFGAAARRVRAAAPQRRHHSCSGASGAPHSGQPSVTGRAADAAGAGGGGAPTALTGSAQAGGGSPCRRRPCAGPGRVA